MGEIVRKGNAVGRRYGVWVTALNKMASAKEEGSGEPSVQMPGQCVVRIVAWEVWVEEEEADRRKGFSNRRIIRLKASETEV